MKRNSNIHISGKTKNLYWLVNGAMLIAIMGGIFSILLFVQAWWRGPQTLLTDIYIPMKLVASFSPSMPQNIIVDGNLSINMNFAFLCFSIFTATLILAVMEASRMCEVIKLSPIQMTLSVMFVIIIVTAMLYSASSVAFRLSSHSFQKPMPMAENFIAAARNGDQVKTAQMLSEKNLLGTLEADILFIEFGLYKGIPMPRERYEHALENLHLVAAPGTREEGQLAYALDYQLHGKAVSRQAQQYFDAARTDRRVWLITALVCLFMMGFLFAGAIVWRKRLARSIENEQ
jgi:hypothetical protein